MHNIAWKIACKDHTESLLVVIITLLVLIFVLFIFLRILNNGGGNPIQIPDTILAYPPSTVVGLLEDTNLFQ